jgi:transcriptional regulator with XRE-family HTH domain
MSNLRTRKGWTLREMSAATCIPLSTLAKVEHDRLTLSYDRIQQICCHLSMKLSDLLLLDRSEIAGRRSISKSGDEVQHNAPGQHYHYPSVDLQPKKMAPAIVKVRSKAGPNAQPASAHAGEEFIHVLAGRLEVHTEFYAPAVLEVGESIYIDANMAHALFAAADCEEATCLVVLSSPAGQPAPPLHELHCGSGS